MNPMYNDWYYAVPYDRLTTDEMEWNANKAMTALRQNNFTIYAAAGIVGNMWAESGMNPGQWQVINHQEIPYVGGYGLVQWTPYTNYSDWAVTDWENNGPKEIERILYERENGLEFFPSVTYPQWTWRKYSKMAPEEGLTQDETVNQAASVFLYNYLRPSDPAGSEANRKYLARYVFHNCPGSYIPPWLLLWWNNKNRKVIK